MILRLRYICAILCCALLFVGCQSDEPAAKIEVSTFQHTFSADGGNLSVTFSANRAWNVSVASGAEWLRIGKSMGEPGTDIELTITAIANEGDSSREGEVLITAGDAKASITLKQNEPDAPPVAFIEIADDDYSVGVTGAEITIPFTTNYAWVATVTEGAEWL